MKKPDGREPAFGNAKFFLWFAPKDDVDASIWTRLAPAEAKRAQECMAQKRAFTWQEEVQAGPRKVSITAEMCLLEEEGSADPLILLQAQNISKQKEAEYMLDSYSQMGEKNAKELSREKERVEKLLLNIMPRSVYEEMRDYGSTTPRPRGKFCLVPGNSGHTPDADGKLFVKEIIALDKDGWTTNLRVR